ncbi:IL6RA protein, partial [Anseranas semipalmata]|nr:IL6RA protein [Anseranas semipalmata]
LSQDTVLGCPGANVTLTCGAEGLPNDTVSWRMGNRELAAGNALLLRRLQREDSGLYGCYAGGRALRTLRLLVEEPPETPRVSCYRRSHDKDVLCEWRLRGEPPPGTRAMLWV